MSTIPCQACRSLLQAGVLVHFDFSHLHTRDCIGLSQPGTVNSDYETWSPTDGMSNCILGQTSVYVRRLRDAACFSMCQRVHISSAHAFRCGGEAQRASRVRGALSLPALRLRVVGSLAPLTM
jgi:hypothetical protein